MIKKCKQTQRLLERYLRSELSLTAKNAVESHVTECDVCRAALSFHKALDLRLTGTVEPPVGFHERVGDLLSGPSPRRSPLIQLFGDPKMKKYLFSSTAVAAAFVSALVLLPGQAHGSSAKEKFVAMRSALARAAQDGQLTISAIATNGGLASLTILLNGNPLPPDVPVTTTSKDVGDAIDYKITIDLSDNNFSSIKYGADQNTLNLIPKAKPSNIEVVHLDPKSGMPTNWSTFRSDQGTMQKISSQSFNSGTSIKNGSAGNAESTNSKSAKPSDGLITVHMRIGKSKSNGTMTITKHD